MFKVGDEIDCVITEIDKEKRRIAISHKLTLDNPYEVFSDKFPEGSEVSGVISSSNEYAYSFELEITPLTSLPSGNLSENTS